MEGYLNYLKGEYEKVEATSHLKDSGWKELAGRIGLLEVPKKKVWLRNFVAVLAVVLILLAGTYQIAQAAIPGDPLYEVKLLSEKIIQKTSGSNQIVIDHRAEEIVGLSRAQEVDREALEKVVIEYKQNVNQAKVNRTSVDFQNKLDEQHAEFDRIGRNDPEIEKEIKDAREASNRESGHGGD